MNLWDLFEANPLEPAATWKLTAYQLRFEDSTVVYDDFLHGISLNVSAFTPSVEAILSQPPRPDADPVFVRLPVPRSGKAAAVLRPLQDGPDELDEVA